MKYKEEELIEAKREIDSFVHNFRQSLKVLKKENDSPIVSSKINQMTKQIKACEIASYLIEKTIEEID